MNFASDNITGVAPEILKAIEAAGEGTALPYGDDDNTRAAEAKVGEVFETEVRVFMVATGTASNALALAAMTPPWGAVICHEGAHIFDSECGAPEFYSGGAKLLTIPASHAKIGADGLDAFLRGAVNPDRVHQVQPACVSIAQATEAGTLYTVDDVAAIAGVCRRHGLKLHMDGARFANAVQALGCSAAEITWKAGVAALSLGGTKNGALACEAVVLFDKDLADGFAYRRKRAGHVFSKMRLFSVQMEAYLTDGLWLKNAAHANAMAARMAEGLGAVPGSEFIHPVEANEMFVRLPAAAIEGLKADGYQFYERGGENVIRLVFAFNTREEDVDGFIATAKKHAGA